MKIWWKRNPTSCYWYFKVNKYIKKKKKKHIKIIKKYAKVLLDATKPQEGSNGTSENNHYSDANDNNQASIFFLVW
jgi:hypothetical protein